MVDIKTHVLAFFIFTGFSVFASVGHAQNISEHVVVDSLKVGDTFNFSITLDRDQEYDDIIFPDSSQFGSAFEIRSRKQFKVSSFKDSVHYKLQFFNAADTTLPQLPVYLVQDQDTTALYTNPVPIRFHSVLAQDEGSFRPLKPIFEFARNWWPYILGFILLAIAGYYGYQYYLKQQEKEESEPLPTFSATPFVNPLKELEDSIKALDHAELSTQEDFKAFYISLGDAIRQYYESLYNLPALESTSRELLTMLQNGSIDQDLIAETRAVLQEADMVKFAKFTPSTDQANRALEKAYDFLDRAQDVDGPRIAHLRRKHQANTEADRERFYEEQKTEQVNA